MPDVTPPVVEQVAQAAAPHRMSTPEFLVLVASALAIGVAGYLHGRLFHEGYGQVPVVGPLFLLNAIGSGIVIALLFLRRVVPYCLGALFISVASLAAILISHSSSFFGFAEHRYDARATTIVVAEIAATVLVLVVLGFSRAEVISPERVVET